MTDAEFRAAVLAELRTQTRLLRLQRDGEVRAAVVAAVAEEFGPGTFTTKGLLDLHDEDPEGELAQALALAVDPASPNRAVILGLRLKGWKDAFEALDEYRRGARLFRLRGG